MVSDSCFIPLKFTWATHSPTKPHQKNQSAEATLKPAFWPPWRMHPGTEITGYATWLDGYQPLDPDGSSGDGGTMSRTYCDYLKTRISRLTHILLFFSRVTACYIAIVYGDSWWFVSGNMETHTYIYIYAYFVWLAQIPRTVQTFSRVSWPSFCVGTRGEGQAMLDI